MASNVVVTVALLCLFVALVFGIIALGAPNWMDVVGVGSSDGSRGLWMNCYSSTSRCYDKVTSTELFHSEWQDFEKITAGFYLASVLCVLIAFVLCILSLSNITDSVTAGIFAIISAVCGLVAVALWGGFWTKQINSRQVYMAWAYILAVLHMLLSLVAGILSVVGRRRVEHY